MLDAFKATVDAHPETHSICMHFTHTITRTYAIVFACVVRAHFVYIYVGARRRRDTRRRRLGVDKYLGKEAKKVARNTIENNQNSIRSTTPPGPDSDADNDDDADDDDARCARR